MASGTHGAISFNNGTISLNELLSGTNSDVHSLTDLKDRIPAAPLFDDAARVQAYVDLYTYQAAAKLSRETLWLRIYSAPATIRELRSCLSASGGSGSKSI